MRRFSQPAIEEIDDGPAPPDLSYQVYKPGTPVRPSAKSLEAIEVPPKTSVALRVCLVLLGLCVVFGTAAAVIAVSSDDAPKVVAPPAASIAPPVVSTTAPIIEPPPPEPVPTPIVTVSEPEPAPEPPPAGGGTTTSKPKPKASTTTPPPPASLKNIAPPPNPYGAPPGSRK